MQSAFGLVSIEVGHIDAFSSEVVNPDVSVAECCDRNGCSRVKSKSDRPEQQKGINHGRHAGIDRQRLPLLVDFKRYWPRTLFGAQFVRHARNRQFDAVHQMKI